MPVPAQRHRAVAVEHRRYDGNIGCNTSHVDSTSPATQLLVKVPQLPAAMVGAMMETEDIICVMCMLDVLSGCSGFLSHHVRVTGHAHCLFAMTV